MIFRQRLFLPASLLIFTISTVALAQTPLQCSANAERITNIRGNGEAELTGDVIVTCTGGTPTLIGQAVPGANFTISASVPITSRLLAAGWSEALLLIDEPAANTQLACLTSNGVCVVQGTNNNGTYNGTQGHPNVFQAQQNSPNQLLYSSIPLDPPGVNKTRILRFTNMRVNAGGGVQSATLSVSASAGVQIGNATVTAAAVSPGVNVTTKGVQTGLNGLAQFTISVNEALSNAFKTRTSATDPNTSPQPVNQNSPGQSTPGTETGFYNGSFLSISGRGNLGSAGLADDGTRLLVQFTGVPQGARLVTATSVPLSPGSGVASLISTDSNGVGPYRPADTATLLPDSSGNVVAVYEILTADPATMEHADLPFSISYSNGSRLDVLSASAGIAPQNTVGTPDTSAPLPRFNGLTTLQVSSLSITPTSIPQGAVGSQYSVAFTAVGGTGPYTWTATGLPPGLTLSSTGILSGVPTTTGAYSAQVTVTDSTKSAATASYTLSISTGFLITTASLPNGTVTVPYSAQIQYTGASGSVLFSIPTNLLIPQNVPPGLKLSPAGVFAGTPTATGSYTFTVEADDSAGHQATARYTVSISPPLTISSVSPLPSFAAGGGQQTFQFVAQGGTPPYTFSIDGSAPPGLSLTPGGLLVGNPTAAGKFQFTLRVTDAQQVSITKQFQITITPAPALLQVSSNQLNFTSLFGGDPPPPQTLVVTSSSLTPVNFTATLDSGTTGSAAPRWLTVQPTQGVTPAGLLVIVDQSSLVVGIADARIHISIPNDATRPAIDVGVHLDVNAAAPMLEALPAFVRLRARAASAQTLKQMILLHDVGGSGPISYEATVVRKSPWITNLSVTGGRTAFGRATPLIVTVNTAGLKTGIYRDVIHFAWSANSANGAVDVPIDLFVADPGPIMAVDERGLRFIARQGAGSFYTQTVKVLNLGDPASTVSWTADLLNGSDWLALNTNRGTSTPGAPGTVVLSVTQNAVNLSAGAHWAVIRFTDLFSQGSPVYVVAILDIAPASAPPQPELSTGMLYFSTSQGSTSAQSGTIRVFTSSTNPVNFQASATTNDGGAWLQVNPTSTSASTATPGSLSVAINPTGLAGGIYKGQINVAMGGIFRTKDVTLVVVSNTAAAAFADGPRDAGCTPSKLVLTLGNLSTSFQSPVQYPAVISAQVNDNCNNPVAGASVSASFSNGDPPLQLLNDGISNTYTETWQPGNAQAGMSVTVRADLDPYQEAVAVLSGTADMNAAPVLNRGGTTNNLNPRLDAPIAPGTVAAIYGSNLAPAANSPGVLPLLTSVNGTFVLVGGTQLPLYYVSPGQINAQIPVDVPVNKPQSVLVGSGGGYTLPDTIYITPVDPGVAASPNGQLAPLLIAQHADFTLVDANHPAHASETLIMYLVGMGATNPAVGTGQQAPSTLASVTTAATVTVSGQQAQVVFAGLTPGGIGLYQINFVVPSGTPAANVDVVVTQGDSGISNTSQLIVR